MLLQVCVMCSSERNFSVRHNPTFFFFRASLIAQLVKNLPAMQESPVSIPGSERSAGERIGYLLWYSWASLWLTQLVKNPPAMWETWV